jgi:hypothetical protein
MAVKTALVVAVALLAVAGCSNSEWSAFKIKQRAEDAYVIKTHTVTPATERGPQEDDYIVVYGADVLSVKYEDSQTSTAKPGDFPGSGLHHHAYYPDPDLSQVPQLGVPIRRCKLSDTPSHDGSPVIAIQPTPEPCMIQLGDTLHYEPSPNGPVLFTYVNFDVISEKAQ